MLYSTPAAATRANCFKMADATDPLTFALACFGNQVNLVKSTMVIFILSAARCLSNSCH